MSKKVNLINSIISMMITLGLVFVSTFFCNKFFTNSKLYVVVIFMILGAVVAGFIATLFHELGHLIVGKKNNFAFISITVWFLKWYKRGNKIHFDFVGITDAGGVTEMIAKSTDNIKKNFYKMTLGGILFTLIAIVFGVMPFVLPKFSMPFFAFFSMFLPIGAYCLLENALPMSNNGARNDGAVLWGLNKDDAESKVVLSILSIYSELYNGKMPSEVNKDYYFNVPQLAEDNLNFVLINNLRYDYYLDLGDFENAKKTTERLEMVYDYFSKEVVNILKVDALYNSCTFDYNEDKADDLVYELEKFLNQNNTVATVRAKLAYILYVKQEKDNLDIFYKKGIKEANRSQIKGYAEFEKKLLKRLKENF